jgi:hypothetical protein
MLRSETTRLAALSWTALPDRIGEVAGHAIALSEELEG